MHLFGLRNNAFCIESERRMMAESTESICLKRPTPTGVLGLWPPCSTKSYRRLGTMKTCQKGSKTNENH